MYLRPPPSTAKDECTSRYVETWKSSDCATRDQKSCDPNATGGLCYWNSPELIAQGAVCVNKGQVKNIEYQNVIFTADICHNLCQMQAWCSNFSFSAGTK